MDYINELEKAIEYIERNLKSQIHLEDVANVVNISPFHFHRIFKAVVGETLMGYVRTRKLTESLKEILTSDIKILDIALTYGFESQESFTRSFKNYFGVTPGKLRKKTAIRKHNGRPKFSVSILRDVIDRDRYQPKIVRLDAIKLVGVACEISLPIDMDKLSPSDAWKILNENLHQIKNRKINKTFGLQVYPNSFGPDDGVFKYMASVEVESYENIIDPFEVYEVEENDYVVYEYKGIVCPETMTMLYANIYGRWIFNLPYEIKGKFDFEFYDARYSEDGKEGSMFIYIPIKLK